MDKMTYAEVQAAVEAATTTALAQTPAVAVPPHAIGDNVTLCVQLKKDKPTAFVVVAACTLGWKIYSIYRDSEQKHVHGPSLESLLSECSDVRAAAYESRGCSDKDYVDAVTKKASSDPATKTAGAAQEKAVLAARLQIKTDFPKPQ